MLTNEKVLDIFRDYLEEDQATEIVQTRHGLAVMLWDNAGQDWSEVVCCTTPEELFDKLLDSFIAYQEFLILDLDDREDLTTEEKNKVRAMGMPYLEKRKEAEKA